MTSRVVVIGGGYGGIRVSRALDEVAEVTLLEPKDTFVHNVAALRALTDESWVNEIFLPYDNLLKNGRVVHDRVVSVDGTVVTVGSGDVQDWDYVVLATGSRYPFPAKWEDRSDLATRRLEAARRALDDARSVLLLGAGPVGLELAGEIRAVWPSKMITIVDPVDDVLGGRLSAEFRTEVLRQLDQLGIALELGSPLVAAPADTGPVVARTADGRRIEADVWFRCFGIEPTTDYLVGELASARRPDGHLTVTPQLTLPADSRVHALGDITGIDEPKMAKAAELHADVIAANIRARIEGRAPAQVYTPAAPGMSLPLGPRHGVSYNETVGVLGAEKTAALKGADLRVDLYRAALGL